MMISFNGQVTSAVRQSGDCGSNPLCPACRTLLELLTDGLISALGSLGKDSEEQDAERFQQIRGKIAEIVALTLRTSDPGEAGAYALGSLRQQLDYSFELLFGPKRKPALASAEEKRQTLLTQL